MENQFHFLYPKINPPDGFIFKLKINPFLREMASEDCVLSLGSSDPSYRTKQMASDDALDPGSRVSR